MGLKICPEMSSVCSLHASDRHSPFVGDVWMEERLETLAPSCNIPSKPMQEKSGDRILDAFPRGSQV